MKRSGGSRGIVHDFNNLVRSSFHKPTSVGIARPSIIPGEKVEQIKKAGTGSDLTQKCSPLS